MSGHDAQFIETFQSTYDVDLVEWLESIREDLDAEGHLTQIDRAAIKALLVLLEQRKEEHK